MQEKGYLPKAMLNFVALLGWHPGEHNTQEVFELDELVEQVFEGFPLLCCPLVA